MDRFDGRTAVITGGASGIGLALAHRFGADGMNVAIADIEEGPLQEAVAALEAAGIDTLGVVTDVADAASVAALADEVAQRFGDVHLLCNNAGIGGGGSLIEPDDLEHWELVLGVNLWGVVHGIKAFVPAMLAHGEPCHVVNTASIAGLLSAPGMGSYNASKYAVVAISETLSMETADTELGVSVLCPGFVQTRIHDVQRHLPEHLVPGGELTEDQEMVRAMVEELVQAGLPPADVADLVHDAVAGQRFLVFPHPRYADQVTRRTELLLAGEAPASWEP